MSSIQIRPATIADKDAIFHVHYEALKPFHDFYAAFFKVNPRESMPVATEKALNNPDIVFLVAEEGESIVGFIRYGAIGASRPDSAKKDAQDEKQSSGSSLWDTKEHLKNLWERFNERQAEMDACQEKVINGESHLFIQHLMVHPNHQRKGIGRMLLQRVIDRADADAVPTLLISSAEAHALYSKMGFIDLGTWPIDNGYWAREIVSHERALGIEGSQDLAQKFEGVKEVEACMIRRPK